MILPTPQVGGLDLLVIFVDHQFLDIDVVMEMLV